MAAARKQKRFQWNIGNKIENRIHYLSNFKAQIECENIDFIQIRLHSTRLLGKP